jgi:pilus assembly protein CpaD
MNPSRLFTLILVCAFALSVGGCAESNGSPMKKPPRGMPDDSSIGFDGKSAIAPDCNMLSRASTLTDAGYDRPEMAWGCATYTNLAAQIANPKDLVAPEKLGPADAAVAASAVHRYETGQIVPLDTATSRTSK